MTTLDVSGDPGSTPAGNGDGGDGSNPPSSTDIMSGLDQGSRDWITNNGIKTDDPAAMLSGVVTKSREMESLIGKSLRLPGEDAKPEDLDAFYDKATERLRPQEASGYDFAPPEDMPEDVPYNSEFADQFRQFAFDAKIPKFVANKTHDWFVQMAVESQKAQAKEHLESYTKQVTDASAEVATAWGPQGSEKFKTEQEYFYKGAKGLGILDDLKSLGVIDDQNQIAFAKPVIALAKVGRAMFGEDTLETGESFVGANPFADDTKSWSKQDEIVRKDPDLARRLIKQAGKDPATWRL